jgi:radical SAM superfamily enzyme YgiQ (UPF0313 family)
MMKTVICMLNSKYIHSSLAPWYLLAGTEFYCDAGIHTEVVESTINADIAETARRIIAEQPNVIGFCCYIWNITYVKQLLKLVKRELPDAVIILGGPEVSYNAEEILETEPLADFVVSGEGEKPFALLLNALYNGNAVRNASGEATWQNPRSSSDSGSTDAGVEKHCADVRGIPGVCYRAAGQPVAVMPFIAEDDPPSPYTEQYFEALNGRIAYLETSRGCAFSCAFCLSGRCGRVRFFDLERAKKELLLLAGSGTQTVKLVDRTFNIDRRRANEIFRFIIENAGSAIPEGVCFHFEVAGDLLEDETLSLLSSAPKGLIQLEIGLQSFNSKTLEAVNRKTDTERLKENIRRLISFGNMHIHIDLIAGLPLEHMESFADSFNTAFSLKPHMLQLGFLKLLHGSPMREDPESFPCRYREDPPYEVTGTPWISADEFVRLHRTEDALERLYNSGRFRRTLEYLLDMYSPFDLFSAFGEYAAGQGETSHSLDGYTAIIFEYFGSQNGIDRTVLRDKLVCDRLASNASGKLPQVLRVEDKGLKKALSLLNEQEETRPQRGVKRGYALLYSENALVYADYKDRDPVTGEYKLNKLLLDCHI